MYTFLIGLIWYMVACNDPNYNSRYEMCEFSYVKQKVQDSEGSVLFMFFTDTHITNNILHTTNIINNIQKTIQCPSVFWGGDAITAYSTDMEREWEIQNKMFDSISLHSHIYAIRGNHDFTYKDRNTGVGKTLSQKEVADRIMNSCTTNIISDYSNDSACYYYVDDIYNKIRYIVFDTNDQGVYGDIPWGYKNSVSNEQLRWIAQNAILTTPDYFGIIFFSHIPILHNFNTFFQKVERVLVASAKKEQAIIDDEIYDFSQMNIGTRVLAVVSGHNHHDMQVYSGGILQIITASDALYNDYKISPLADYYPIRTKGTDREQVVELCKYNHEDDMLLFFRFGYGGNRFFHLSPIEMSVGDSLLLPITIKKTTVFGAYDNDSKYNRNNKIWNLNHNVINIDINGCITAQNNGESTVYAINSNGDTEFFDILVK